MEYTNEMCEEDKRIAQFVFNKSFKNYAEYKDDMIQVALIGLVRARELYQEDLGRYFTYASTTCKRAFIRFIEQEKKQSNNIANLSLDTSCNGEDDDLVTLSDFLGYEENYLQKETENELKTAIKKIILKQRCKDILEQVDPKRNLKKKTNRIKQQQLYAIDFFVNGKNIMQIAEENGVTRQAIHRAVVKFRPIIIKELKEKGLIE